MARWNKLTECASTASNIAATRSAESDLLALRMRFDHFIDAMLTSKAALTTEQFKAALFRTIPSQFGKDIALEAEVLMKDITNMDKSFRLKELPLFRKASTDSVATSDLHLELSCWITQLSILGQYHRVTSSDNVLSSLLPHYLANSLSLPNQVLQAVRKGSSTIHQLQATPVIAIWTTTLVLCVAQRCLAKVASVLERCVSSFFESSCF